MKPFTLTRMMRLSPTVSAEGVRDGLASTWNLIEHDGFQLVRGCFDQFVQRINGGGVLPVLWQHARMQPPIGRVRRLAEEDGGLRFWFKPNGTDLARAVAANIDDETATDVSVNIVAWATDPSAPHRIVKAELDEISICTTGFAADPGAGLGRIARLGLFDAAEALACLASAKRSIEALTTYLTTEYGWGDPVSDELEQAIRAEASGLDSFLTEQLSKLIPQEN